jgi:hypothetical protein
MTIDLPPPISYEEYKMSDEYLYDHLEDGDWNYYLEDIGSMTENMVMVYIDGKFKCWKNLMIEKE